MTVFSRPVPWLASVTWVSAVLLTFMLGGAQSARAWLLMAVVSVVPCAVLLRLWNDGPPPTVAEVIRATEDRR